MEAPFPPRHTQVGTDLEGNEHLSHVSHVRVEDGGRETGYAQNPVKGRPVDLVEALVNIQAPARQGALPASRVAGARAIRPRVRENAYAEPLGHAYAQYVPRD